MASWLLVALLGSAALSNLAPSALAVSYGNFGSKVLTSGQDFNPTYAALPGVPTICSRDLGPVGFSVEDAYYLNMDGAGTVVATFDYRIVGGTSGFTSGTIAGSGDTDVGQTFNGLACAAFAASVRFAEADGLPGWTAADLLYWSADATLGVGDVRIAIATSNTNQDTQSVTAGTVVGALTDADIVTLNNNNGQYPDCTTGPPTGAACTSAAVLCPGGAGCVATAFLMQWFDANINAVFDSNDALLLAYGPAATPAPASYNINDVYLYNAASGVLGTRVMRSSVDYLVEPELFTVAPTLGNVLVAGLGAACSSLFIHFRDHDGIAGRILVDDLVLYIPPAGSTTCGSPTPASTVAGGTRVSNVATHLQGTALNAQAGLAGLIFFVDANSNGVRDLTDPVYINRPVALGGGADALAVSAGDYRVTTVTVGSSSFTAGTVVGPTDADITTFATAAINPGAGANGWVVRKLDVDGADEIPLQTLATVMYHDADADSVWDPPVESVYLDVGVTANGCGAAGTTLCVNSGDFLLFDGTDLTSAGPSTTVAMACPGAGNDCAHADGHFRASTDFKVTGTDTAATAAFGETIYFSRDLFVNDEDFALSAATGSGIAAGQVAFQCGTGTAACLSEGVHSSDLLFLSWCPGAPAVCPGRQMLGDVQVSPSLGTRFTTSTSADFVPSLRALPTAGGTLLRYNRGDPGSVGDDVFYASTDGATVTVQDGRLTPFDSTRAAGTVVASADSEELAAAIVAGAGGGLAALIGARDIDGTAGYTLNDHVYVNNPGGALGGTVDAILSAFDARISDVSISGQTFTPGTLVLPGNADVVAGTAFVGLGAWTIGFHDDNLNAVFDTGDVMYALPPGAPALGTFPQPVLGALRLIGPGGATSPGTGGGVVTPPPPPPPPPPGAVPASIAITSPPSGGFVRTGSLVNITGTASGGALAGGAPVGVSSVGVTVNGAVRNVTGTTSWSASFTPATDGTYTIVATVFPATGASAQATATVTANPTGTAPPTGPTLQQQLEQLIQQNAALSGQLNQTLSQNTQLQTQLTSLNTELSNQTGQLTQLNNQITSLQAENADLKKKLEAGQAATTPGFEALLLLAALGIAFAARRRRA